ncbi:hypothetical protein SAMN06266787_1196 [Halorubrum ezzemoulense]|uniref:Uncharacterized protein n=1 Tax=Halorubrum ezzemoulense TaxID=337243 RepID=A0A238YTB1_HALEZ|nr:hypothetical protein SAMN06266787_1196 [Halorubrum ezzemoulense]
MNTEELIGEEGILDSELLFLVEIVIKRFAQCGSLIRECKRAIADKHLVEGIIS